MTQYTHTTFATAKARLSERLSDTSNSHWTDSTVVMQSEVGRYIIDGIRLFNAVAGLHRAQDSFNTAVDTPFYDLPSMLTSSGGRLSTVRDADVLGMMQWMLMENYSPSLFTNLTEMWTSTEMIQALQRARDQFIDETGCALTRRPVIVAGGGSDTFALPDTVMSIRRAVWRDTNGNYTQLWPSDERLMINSALSPGVPTSYSIVSVPELSVRLSPSPASSGTIELLACESGAALDPTANGGVGTLLGVPDDLVAGVRYRALATLLRKDGPAKDSARAQACEELYSMYVDIARSLPVVLNATIDGARVIPTTLTRLDGNRSGWQGKNSGTPDSLAIAGISTVAVCPVPDGSAHSIGLEFVRSAIIPTSNTDYIQVPREAVDGILAWAEMLACFKSEGTEFENARAASKLLLERASFYNSKRVQQSLYLQEMMRSSTDELIDRPLYSGGDDDSAPSERRDTASSRQSVNRSLMKRRKKTLGGR